MAELEAGAKVARDLGIYLGQLYGWVKKGTVKNHKEDGYPNGKGLIVDPDEARAAWMASKKKGPRAPREPRAKGERGAGNGRQPKAEAPRTKRLKAGTIVSYEHGQSGSSYESHKPQFTIAQVLGSTGKLTFIDDGDHHIHYSGALIDNKVFTTERLSYWMARGVVRIERPHHVLGMVLLSFVMEGREDLAQSLEDWMEANELPVQVPEIMDLPDDEGDDEAAVAVASEDED
jgi:hypothetical protein